MLQPSMRFTKPHLAHHTSGVFGTKDDPQYPLIKSNPKLALIIFVVLPWLLPIYNLIMCFNIKRIDWFDNILYRNITFTIEEYAEIKTYEIYYIYTITAVLLLFPTVLVHLYLVSVIAWFLSVLRIPLEHDLKEYKETSTMEDQRLDSRTHEAWPYVIIQPLGLRYHEEHHTNPKVPYHNLGVRRIPID